MQPAGRNSAVRDEVLAALRAALAPAGTPGIAVIHSSLAALAPERAPQPWDLLYAVDRLAREGWTLAFPAFTFSFTRTGEFDPARTPSETGVLADWVLDGLPAAIRTRHPIYSFAVIGPQAGRIAACPSETTFGDTSPFGLFDRENARIVMLGADWSFCTPFHRFEELAEVSYRHFKDFPGTITDGEETRPTSARMYVRDLGLDPVNDWRGLVRQMAEAGAITRVPLWRGGIESASMADIRAAAETLLAGDGLAFLGNGAEVRHRAEMAAEADRSAPYKVALLGSSNLDIARHDLAASLAAAMPGRRCDIRGVPFGQLAQQVMMPGSELAEFGADLAIFADRLEDLLGLAGLDLADPEVALDAARAHGRTIRHFADTTGGALVVHRFALAGRQSLERQGELRALVASCNAALEEALDGLPDLTWLDPGVEAAATEGPVTDPRLWHLGRIPFARPYGDRLVRRWTGVVLARLGKTARLLVLDLDNTLWGGVLGEDGAEGILIGGDFPGNAFARFQQTLKGLSERGIALAVSSKNDADLALDVLATHAEIAIRPDMLVAHRIDWQPKWQNIRDMAAELDLGLGSVMFIDDNPVEREAVRRNLPAVQVLDLPADPTAYVDALLDSPFLEVLQTGASDRKRVASYKTRAKINAARQASASVEDFLRGLEMRLTVRPLDGDTLARAAQLCQKTNQFNTTTRRHTARDLEALRDGGADVAVIGLADRFSEPENIGLIVLKPTADGGGEIDLFLLSCRVLGRTVERAVLDWATARARARGWSHLAGEIVETPRNTPARKVYAENGFTAAAPGWWRREAQAATPPDWFTLHDGFAAL